MCLEMLPYALHPLALQQTIECSSEENSCAKEFLADRTIGRAFGTLCRLSVCRL